MLFLVHVAEDLESDNILEPVHKGLVPGSPLLKTAVAARWNVAQQDSHFTVCLHLIKGLFQPLKLITRVVSELHQEEVGVVAGFSVHSDHTHLIHHRAITELQLLGIKAVDCKLFLSVLAQPYFPQIQVVSDHRIGLSEVLGVNSNTEIVVSFKRISRPLAEVGLHVVSQVLGVLLHMLKGVLPLVVRHNVASPEQHIWSQLVDLVAHLEQNIFRDVTKR